MGAAKRGQGVPFARGGIRINRVAGQNRLLPLIAQRGAPGEVVELGGMRPGFCVPDCAGELLLRVVPAAIEAVFVIARYPADCFPLTPDPGER